MVKRVNPDDLSSEEEFEMKAAFGDAVERGEIVELEPDDLEPVEDTLPKSFADVDEVAYDGEIQDGDEVTVRFMSGTEFTGTCTSTRTHGFTLENDEEPGGKILSYEDFEGPDEPGICHELVSVN